MAYALMNPHVVLDSRHALLFLWNIKSNWISCIWLPALYNTEYLNDRGIALFMQENVYDCILLFIFWWNTCILLLIIWCIFDMANWRYFTDLWGGRWKDQYCHDCHWIFENLPSCRWQMLSCNSSFTGQNGCHFADNVFKCIFLNEKFVFWLILHWSLFLRVQLTITQHWFK